jgi:hypothetical protein
MKALSLWQPWAVYIAAGMKRFETRSWPTDYRGPLAIHAAKRPMAEEDHELLGEYPLPEPFRSRPLVFGAVVAVCQLVDVVRMDEQLCHDMDIREGREFDLGGWEPGRYAWALASVEPLREPVFVRGAQGLWEWNR